MRPDYFQRPTDRALPAAQSANGVSAHVGYCSIPNSVHVEALSQNCEKRLLATSVSVRPSKRMEKLASNWMVFHESWYLSIFRKPVEIHVSLNSDKNAVYFTWRPTHICDDMWLTDWLTYWLTDWLTDLLTDWLTDWLTDLLTDSVLLRTKVVQEIKTHISCPITIIRKTCRLWGSVEKCCKARQATDDSFYSVYQKCSTHTIKGAPRQRFPIIWVKRFLNDIATSTTSTRLSIHKIPITIKSSTYTVSLSHAILRFLFTFYILYSDTLQQSSNVNVSS